MQTVIIEKKKAVSAFSGIFLNAFHALPDLILKATL